MPTVPEAVAFFSRSRKRSTRLATAPRRASAQRAAPAAAQSVSEFLEDRIGAGDAVVERRFPSTRVNLRIDDTVQNHRSHAAREHVGIGGSEKASIRPAEIRERTIAEQFAQILQVANRVGR